jgi:hypothetical protein
MLRKDALVQSSGKKGELVLGCLDMLTGIRVW